MRRSGNTILITGGSSGIGRALAAAFQADGNQVIIAGRRQDALDETTAAHPGMHSAVLDIGDAASIATFAETLLADHPTLDVVIHNAGIMAEEKVVEGRLDVAEATVATNLLGPIRLTAALLPALLKRPNAAIVTVTSGLAFVPLSLNPTYCATKAAIHSYTQSLRYQLRGTSVQVIELAPPYVRTSLQGDRQANDPAAMPVDEFVAEVMGLFHDTPDATEILVDRVKQMRGAEASGQYDAFYERMNAMMVAARTKH